MTPVEVLVFRGLAEETIRPVPGIHAEAAAAVAAGVADAAETDQHKFDNVHLFFQLAAYGKVEIG